MLRSLRSRLLLLTLGVAALAVLATAWVSSRATAGDISDTITNDLVEQQIIFENLGTWAAVKGWDNVGPLVVELSQNYDERIRLTSIDNQPIADSEELIHGRAAPIPRSNLRIEWSNPFFQSGLTENQLGQLRGVRVNLEKCLNQKVIPYEILSADEDPERIAEPMVAPRYAADAQQCRDDNPPPVLESPEELLYEPETGAERTEFGTALLYLGYGDASAEDANLLENGVGWRLLAAVGSVLALAALVTIFMANRILKPVDALTQAAQRMGDGKLDERVPARRDDEIGDLGRAFNGMAASVEESLELRRRMTSDVAHELRTPISNIRGYLEAAQDGIMPVTPALIDSLHEDTLHLQNLVSDLQELSMAEAGQLKIAKAPTDIDDLVGQVVGAHAPMARDGQVELAVIESGGGLIDLDSRRIRQVLTNLISNALRHTDPGGSVHVAVSRDNGHLSVAVSDTGTGIPPDDLPHVFDRFFRADLSRNRATGGSGLGLAITKEFVLAHDGDIAVSSTPDVGSTFTVTLPTGGTPAPDTSGLKYLDLISPAAPAVKARRKPPIPASGTPSGGRYTVS